MNKDAFHLFGYGLYVVLDFCCSTKCNRNLDVCEGHQKTTSYACMCSATWYIPNTHAYHPNIRVVILLICNKHFVLIAKTFVFYKHPFDLKKRLHTILLVKDYNIHIT